MKTVLQLKLEYGLKFKPGYYFNIDATVLYAYLRLLWNIIIFAGNSKGLVALPWRKNSIVLFLKYMHNLSVLIYIFMVPNLTIL